MYRTFIMMGSREEDMDWSKTIGCTSATAGQQVTVSRLRPVRAVRGPRSAIRRLPPNPRSVSEAARHERGERSDTWGQGSKRSLIREDSVDSGPRSDILWGKVEVRCGSDVGLGTYSYLGSGVRPGRIF